jgi:hypothetical protein
MSTRPNEVGVLDRWVSSLLSEIEDIEEIVRDTEDAPVSQVELLLP